MKIKTSKKYFIEGKVIPEGTTLEIGQKGKVRESKIISSPKDNDDYFYIQVTYQEEYDLPEGFFEWSAVEKAEYLSQWDYGSSSYSGPDYEYDVLRKVIGRDAEFEWVKVTNSGKYFVVWNKDLESASLYVMISKDDPMFH